MKSIKVLVLALLMSFSIPALANGYWAAGLFGVVLGAHMNNAHSRGHYPGYGYPPPVYYPQQPTVIYAPPAPAVIYQQQPTLIYAPPPVPVAPVYQGYLYCAGNSTWSHPNAVYNEGRYCPAPGWMVPAQ